MNNLTFQIENINIERTPFGKTQIEASCYKDKSFITTMHVQVANNSLQDKRFIREQLETEYNRKMLMKESNNNQVQEGDIL